MSENNKLIQMRYERTIKKQNCLTDQSERKQIN